MLIQIPVSVGELVDKITILNIKARRLNGVALDNVLRELDLLEKALNESGVELKRQEREELEEVNEKLWHIEEAIRGQEANQCFGADFIALARSVYHATTSVLLPSVPLTIAAGSTPDRRKELPQPLIG